MSAQPFPGQPTQQAPHEPIPRGADRRRHSRSGRRANDPHVSAWHWRRVAWLFAAYVAVIGLRTLPNTVRRWFKPAQRV